MAGPNPWHGKKVLIVDDSAQLRQALGALFEQMGMKVVGSAVNGVEGLEKLQALGPDLVSLDVMMPEMNGIECYRKIKESKSSVSCVFISILAGDPNFVEKFAQEIPSELFLSKPILQPHLETILTKLFSQTTLTGDKARLVS